MISNVVFSWLRHYAPAFRILMLLCSRLVESQLLVRFSAISQLSVQFLAHSKLPLELDIRQHAKFLCVVFFVGISRFAGPARSTRTSRCQGNKYRLMWCLTRECVALVLFSFVCNYIVQKFKRLTIRNTHFRRTWDSQCKGVKFTFYLVLLSIVS